MLKERFCLRWKLMYTTLPSFKNKTCLRQVWLLLINLSYALHKHSYRVCRVWKCYEKYNKKSQLPSCAHLGYRHLHKSVTNSTVQLLFDANRFYMPHFICSVFISLCKNNSWINFWSKLMLKERRLGQKTSWNERARWTGAKFA